MKVCKGCDAEKPLEDFYKQKSGDGYRSKCKGCLRVQTAAYREGHRDNYNRYAREAYRAQVELAPAATRAKHSEQQCDIGKRMRLRAFMKLGEKCHHCGFDDERALQIDHVNGGGAEERRKFGSSGLSRRVLSDQAGRYQLLCANCNWIKRQQHKEFVAPKDGDKEAKYQRGWRIAKRLELLTSMGNACQRCGETEPSCLQVDHVNRKTPQERRRHKSIAKLRVVVATEPHKFQLLCANCNWIKRMDNREHGGPKPQPDKPLVKRVV